MDLEFSPPPGLHIADYVVVGLFLCICMGIGLYFGYRTNELKTLENYFLGNRRLLMIPVSLSLFVTFQSAISLIGIPAETYVYGIRGSYLGIALAIAVFIGSFTFVPLLYPLRLTSTYEYLELRFKSKSVRTMGTLFGMLQTICYMGVALYAPALALQTVAGIPLWLSIVLIGLTGTVYTAVGGIKAVVWTDVFQCAMIIIGLTATTIKGSSFMDDSMFQVATAGNRLQFFNFDPDPRVRHSVWGTTIGLTFISLPFWCSQSTLQRVSSLRSLTSAKNAMLLQSPVYIVYYMCLGYLGIVLYVYYRTLECDPVQSGFLSNADQLMPFFVLDIFRSLPGLAGIYISCIFSGSLSTLSSGINSLAANTVEDIFGTRIKRMKMISQTIVAKVFVFVYGLVIVGLAYGFNYMSGNLAQKTLSVIGSIGGPLAGIFFLGGFVFKANWIGAMAGSISALIFNIWIVIGAHMYGNRPAKLAPNPTSRCYGVNVTSTSFNVTGTDNLILSYTESTSPLVSTTYGTTIQITSHASSQSDFFLYNLSYTWYGLIGFFFTLIIGTLVSYCTGCNREEPVDTRFIFPFCRKLWGLESKTTGDDELMEQMNMIPDTNTDRSIHAF